MNINPPRPMRPSMGVLPKQNGLLGQIAAQGSIGDDGVKDTELAHVNPREAAVLKAMGGSGTINPRTGLRQYDWRGTDPLSLHHNTWDVNISTSSVMDDLGTFWDRTIGNEGIWGWLGDRLGFAEQSGKYPGDDDLYRTGLRQSQNFRDYLASTEDRAAGIEEMADMQEGLLRDSLSRDYADNKKRYDQTIGRANLSGISGGFLPMDPKQDFITNMDTGLFKLEKDYEDQRYALLASTREAYNNFINNIVSPEYQSEAPSYDEMRAGMDWLQTA